MQKKLLEFLNQTTQPQETVKVQVLDPKPVFDLDISSIEEVSGDRKKLSEYNKIALEMVKKGDSNRPPYLGIYPS